MRDILEANLEKLKAIQTLAPKVGIVLGTGLGGLAGRLKKEGEIGYGELKGFPQSTVESHKGHLSWGRLADVPVVVMEGRFHYYEGYSMNEITLPVRVMKALGVENLIISNAAGGMNPNYNQGDIVCIEDHINFMGNNPLIGPHDNSLGERFPDMIEPYNKAQRELFMRIALEKGIRVHTGVYVGVSGPCLETRAEYRMLRAFGADLVGMSTVPEVIVAVQAGIKVLGLSCVTDICLPDALKPANIDEIIRTAQETEPVMCELVTEFLRRCHA